MTNRDSVLKVDKSRYDASSGKTTVHLFWQGHTAHDYGSTGRIN